MRDLWDAILSGCGCVGCLVFFFVILPLLMPVFYFLTR